MPIGTVKWFNPTKGYGFIQPNDGSKDVFVHISALERSDLGQLVEGQKVQFDLERGQQGKTSAVNLGLAEKERGRDRGASIRLTMAMLKLTEFTVRELAEAANANHDTTRDFVVQRRSEGILVTADAAARGEQNGGAAVTGRPPLRYRISAERREKVEARMRQLRSSLGFFDWRAAKAGVHAGEDLVGPLATLECAVEALEGQDNLSAEYAARKSEIEILTRAAERDAAALAEQNSDPARIMRFGQRLGAATTKYRILTDTRSPPPLRPAREGRRDNTAQIRFALDAAQRDLRKGKAALRGLTASVGFLKPMECFKAVGAEDFSGKHSAGIVRTYAEVRKSQLCYKEGYYNKAVGAEDFSQSSHIDDVTQNLSHPTLPQDTIDGTKENLYPATPPRQLFGRQDLLEEGWRRLLKRELPILFWGIPGIGKSSLLATLVNKPDVQEQYKSNIFWIDLRAAPTAIHIADLIAKALNFSYVLAETLPEPKLRKLHIALCAKRPAHIIVLDNVDHKQHAKEVLRITQYVTSNILVGSRIKFALADTAPLLLRELDEPSSVQLFRLHAKADTEDVRIAAICKLLDYHPLTIILAAAAIRPHTRILEELISGNERDIRSAFTLSYDNLTSPEERYLFDSLGAFAASGAAPFSAITRVAGLPRDLCKELLRRLESVSLVQTDDHLLRPGPEESGRCRLHPLLYDFARERLQERERLMTSGGTKWEYTPTSRMIEFYVEYCDKHREEFPVLEVARDNVIYAAERAKENNAWDAVYNLWDALDEWLDTTGDWTNLDWLLDWIVEASQIPQNREIELAKALASRSDYSERTGKNIRAAMRDAKKSLALGYEVGDNKTIARGLVTVGDIYSEHPDIYPDKVAQAHAKFKEAWDMCQTLPEWDESAYIAYCLANSYWDRGDLSTARDVFKRSIDIGKKFSAHHRSRRHTAFCVTSLGNLLVEQGEYEQGRTQLKESLQLKLELDDKYGAAISATSLARLEVRLGNIEEAIHRFQGAINFYKTIVTVALPQLAQTFSELGTVYDGAGRYTEALAAYEEGLQMADSLAPEDAHIKAIILYKMGRTNATLEHHKEAIDCFEQAHQTLQGLEKPIEIVVLLENLQTTYKLTGQEHKAAELDRTIEAMLMEAARSTKILTLDSLADYYLDRDRLTDARTVLDRANTLLEQERAGQPTTREIREIGLSYRRLGGAYEREGMYDMALASYQQAARMVEGKVQSRTYGVIMHDIGDVYRAQEQLEEAVMYYEKARAYKANDDNVIVTLHSLGDVYAELKKPEKALAAYKEAAERLDSRSK